jgi:MYXO-CTERM domain-containing protein
MMGMQIHFLLDGIFTEDIAGPIDTTLNSDLFYRVNGHILDVRNFANLPGLTRTAFTLDAGMVPNGGVLTDFEGFMQVSVRFDEVSSTLPVDASASMNFLNTAQITSVTATYNGQPLSDFTLTGDSGAVFPTGPLPASTPEPGSLLLAAAGMAALWVWRRQ